MRRLLDRVVAIASWALEAGQVGSADDRDVLREELAALVLTQRGTIATPVWLNAHLPRHLPYHPLQCLRRVPARRGFRGSACNLATLNLLAFRGEGEFDVVGVSKTVSLPADASAEAIKDAFIAAWRLGLKAIVVFREGYKL